MNQKIYFSQSDQYAIDHIPYHFETSDEHSAFFRREDGSGAIERFGWDDLNQIVGSERWSCKRRSLTVPDAKQAPDLYTFVWELPSRQQKMLLRRWFFVSALRKLHAAGEVKLTPSSVEANFYAILKEATKESLAFDDRFGVQYFCSKDNSLPSTAKPGTILRWQRLVKKSGGRIDSLIDKRGKISRIDIDPESYRFIIGCLREYLSEERHSGNAIAQKTISAIRLENEKRRKSGQAPINGRCRSALHDWISKFGEFEIDLGRKGKVYTKRKYSGVGKTERATRPGQTFQADEWEVDARTLIMSGPIREGLEQETLDALPRGRRWLYIVMDVATRYIVGFGISATQSSEAAVRALEMATRDKEDLAQAAGSKSTWRGFTFECLDNDTGGGFLGKTTRRAVEMIQSAQFYGKVGEPQFRGPVERLFGTFSVRAMPYIPAQTFRNPQVRGDYDTEAKVALTDDQLALIFIRFIVDVYHQSEHGGLFGETPSSALERLEGTIGTPPKLTPKTRRKAFGIRQERTVTARGIRFLGIDYGGSNETLQSIRKRHGTNELAFYVDPQNLGTISVWDDGNWLEVRSSIENFEGIKLTDWIETTRILRSRYSAQAELKASVVFDGLNYMRARATEAQRIMGVLPQMPTSADLQGLERELHWGLSVVDDTPTAVQDLPPAESGIGYKIGEISPAPNARQHPTGDEMAVPSSPPAAQTDPHQYSQGSIVSDEDDDDDSWFEEAIKP
ncbi:Mu transposase C-terminal domain-containing protein [Litoreibacter roseus]|uniref:Integrase catalytic domain-containing protein n=1 Tax=Litoreibacter roseus TaxID=2601869 RepID=A0A6N6JFV4_9RHOB|nr:Mu transposase C-terminal domain-containing protein [Litoreibacter roseus]GFE65106.1 hypothetical protein KIN_21800 [Litoreibacter roseus]